MNVDATGARINGLTKQLLVSWRDTKHYWRDAKCREFEQHYLDELFGTVESSGTFIEKLDRVIKQIHKDCE